MSFPLQTFAISLAAILLSTCGPNAQNPEPGSTGAQTTAETLKTIQAYMIYMPGTYSLWENCSPEIMINMSETSFLYDHTVCDIQNITMSETPTGFKLNLFNCRSDNGNEPDTSVVVTPGKKSQIHGWADDPIDIYKC